MTSSLPKQRPRLSLILIALSGLLSCSTGTAESPPAQTPSSVRGSSQPKSSVLETRTQNADTAGADAGGEAAPGTHTAPLPVAPPKASDAAAPRPAPPRTWDQDAYWFVRNVHKHPVPGGPSAGWSLVVRKSDSCLLTVASHGSPKHLHVEELKLGGAGRFGWSKATGEQVLAALERDEELSAGKRRAVLAGLRLCGKGYRVLVDWRAEAAPVDED